MKRIFLFIAACLMTFALQAQTCYTTSYPDKALQKKAKKWYKSQAWRNGFTKASPHKTLNVVDFYLQYHKNQKQWDAMFNWLSHTDLLTIPAGKHPIPGSNLVANVQDDYNRELDTRHPESHYHHIDFQYAVKGVEGFGLADHNSSTPMAPYKPDVIKYNYDLKKAKLFNSNPKTFFLFFPGDWHIPMMKTKKKDQNVRVVVVKLDYVS